jgi:hypothetical protein
MVGGSSTTKTGCHDIAKSGIKTPKKINQIKKIKCFICMPFFVV